MYTQEEAKQIRKKFWTLFGERCEIVPELKYRKKKWVLYDTKISGVDLKFEAGRQEAAVILEVNHRNESRRLEVYEAILKYKAIIESGFAEGLTWDFCYTRENGAEVCRIYTTMQNADVHRQNQWPDIYNFFIKNMLLLESNFLSIRDILKEIITNQKESIQKGYALTQDRAFSTDENTLKR